MGDLHLEDERSTTRRNFNGTQNRPTLGSRDRPNQIRPNKRERASLLTERLPQSCVGNEIVRRVAS